MVVWPVIERELRTTARYSFTYYVRVLAMVALLFQCVVFGAEHGFGPTLGGKLFGSLHYMLFGAIWLLVPFLTADCISRERREGTLGLLFLTELNASHIVTAKSVAHGLRALTLWLAVLPVLTIPFLLGGVSWIEALLSAGISFSAICWALTAGIVASAWSKTWLRAVVTAALLSVCLVLVFGMFVGVTMLQGTRPFPRPGAFQSSTDFVFLTGLAFIGGANGYLRLFTPSFAQVLWSVGILISFSVLALLLGILVAGRKTSRVWQEPPPSNLQIWCQKTFCTPRFWLKFFRRWMLRQIERNPIGWLERRRWSGRLVTWTWFAVVISIYTAGLGEINFRGLDHVQNMIAWLLAASIAISAAGSFRRERESGVLELLLVSPLNESQIMSGRLRGLWGQFLPAFGTLFVFWIYFNSLFRQDFHIDGLLFYLSTFLTLPLIGLYFSLRCQNFLPALIMTLAAGLFLPVLAAACLFPDPNRPEFELRLSEPAACLQVMVAYGFAVALYQRLKKRAFRFAEGSCG